MAIFVTYFALSLACLFTAYMLRFDFNISDAYFENFKAVWPWYLAIQFAFLFAFGQFDAVFSQFRLPDLLRLFLSLVLASTYALFLWYFYQGEGVPPRSVIITNLLLYFTAISGLRIFFRIYQNEGFSIGYQVELNRSTLQSSEQVKSERSSVLRGLLSKKVC